MQDWIANVIRAALPPPLRAALIRVVHVEIITGDPLRNLDCEFRNEALSADVRVVFQRLAEECPTSFTAAARHHLLALCEGLLPDLLVPYLARQSGYGVIAAPKLLSFANWLRQFGLQVPVVTMRMNPTLGTSEADVYQEILRTIARHRSCFVVIEGVHDAPRDSQGILYKWLSELSHDTPWQYFVLKGVDTTHLTPELRDRYEGGNYQIHTLVGTL